MAWQYFTCVYRRPMGVLAPLWVESKDLTEMLNEHGRQGWELVSSVWNTRGNEVTLIFKRPQDEVP